MANSDPGGRPEGRFLDGNPTAWARPLSRMERREEGHLQQQIWDGHQNRISLDQTPGGSWKGWRRQRFEPVLTRFLLPVSWSLFIWALGLMTTLTQATKPLTGSLIALSSPALVIVVCLFLLDKRGTRDAGRFFIRALSNPWNICLMMIITLCLAMMKGQEDTRPLAMATVLLSLLAWLWWTARCSQSLAVSAGRWLLPVPTDAVLPLDAAKAAGWHSIYSDSTWRPGPIAEMRLKDCTLQLKGERWQGQAFLSLECLDTHGTLVDPWITDEQELPLQGLAGFFSMNLKPGLMREQISTLDLNMFSRIRETWPHWTRPEKIGDPSEEE